MTTYIPNLGTIEYKTEERRSVLPTRLYREIYRNGEIVIWNQVDEHVFCFYTEPKNINGIGYNFLVTYLYKQNLVIQGLEDRHGKRVKVIKFIRDYKHISN